MSMKPFVSFIIVAFVFIMGCATTPSPRQSQRTSAIIDAPKDKVWPLLVEEVGSKYPIQTIEKESGVITTQVVKMPVARGNTASFKKYVFLERRTGGSRGRYGGGSSAYESLQMNMRITTTKFEPGKTMITINTYYQALSKGMMTQWVPIRSNGSVENQILTNIEIKLK